MSKEWNKTRRKSRKLFSLLFALCLAFLPWGMKCQAAEYSYTVTFYPGNHGRFTGVGSISVQSSGSEASVEVVGQAIKVSGLRNGDMVSFDAAMDGAVALEEGSQYYVKGIRLSGRDNNTVDTSAFRVEGDRDYVVAYGIRGDMVSYVVNYQDETGNTLASSRNYYGNVGDKPVVAFLYMEGYEPRAYNLTKTLVSNEAENVFTFVYRRVVASGGGNESGGGTGGDSPAGGGSGTGDVVNPGLGDGGSAAGSEPDTDGAPGGIGGIGNEGGNTGAVDGENTDGGMAGGGNGTDDANGGQAGLQGNEGENVELDDEEVPLDLMELDEEEVPLANNILEGMANMEEGSKIFAASTVLVAASAGVLIFVAFWLKKQSKNKDK